MNPICTLFRFSTVCATGAASFLRTSAILGTWAVLAFSAQAQRVGPGTDTSAIPDAPSAVLAAQNDNNAHQSDRQNMPTHETADGPEGPHGSPKQTKRILGVIPNFRAVSADTKLPPQSVKEKFTSAAQQTFDYSDLPLVLVLAGVGQAENSVPQFHQGAAGYARYFWHNAADQIDENFWVQAIIPSITHEDSRYYTLGRGGIPHRALYAFDRTLITRSDRGGNTFNISEVVGSGAAAGISYLYYPNGEKTWTKTGQRWLENGIIDGATYVFQEFWPDINKAIFHQKD